MNTNIGNKKSGHFNTIGNKHISMNTIGDKHKSANYNRSRNNQSSDLYKNHHNVMSSYIPTGLKNIK